MTKRGNPPADELGAIPAAAWENNTLGGLFTWGGGQTIQKCKCLAKVPGPEFGERSGMAACSPCMSLNSAGTTTYRANGWKCLWTARITYKGLA